MKEFKASTRKTIKTRMNSALKDDMSALPATAKKILLDDLVTAFESRLKVLAATQSKMAFLMESEEVIFTNA